MCPAQGKRSIVFGSMLSMTIAFASWPRTSAAAALRAGPTSAASATSRFASVADRPQMRSVGTQRREPRERELRLHAALGRQELVPLVDDDGVEMREALPPVGAREEQRQALGRGDERRRQSLGLLRARAARRCRPVRTSTVQCGRSAAAASASARPVSAASARSGVSHRSVSGGGSPAAPVRDREQAAAPPPRASCPCRSAHAPDPSGLPHARARRPPGIAKAVIPRAASQARAGSERIRSGRGRVRNRSIIGRYSQRGAHARKFSARSRVGRR